VKYILLDIYFNVPLFKWGIVSVASAWEIVQENLSESFRFRIIWKKY